MTSAAVSGWTSIKLFHSACNVWRGPLSLHYMIFFYRNRHESEDFQNERPVFIMFIYNLVLVNPFLPDWCTLRKQHLRNDRAIRHFMISDEKTTLKLIPTMRDYDTVTSVSCKCCCSVPGTRMCDFIVTKLHFLITHLHLVSCISPQPNRAIQIPCNSVERPLGVCVDRHE